ncbi:hypothetical protein [Halorubrum sp. DM2]|uniref:hypothetical protein n=1 Tax=Halorubrum sp. DM2 TaxID=2527867 RepID=UPI0024B7EE4C|nr:hypothetical protein [Halorubrum sp. DM2]
MSVWRRFLQATPQQCAPGSHGATDGLPVLIGYIVWTDARHAIVAVLFFVSASNYLSFFPDEDVPPETVVDILSVVYPRDVANAGSVPPGRPRVRGHVDRRRYPRRYRESTGRVERAADRIPVAKLGRRGGSDGSGNAGPTAVIGACACGCCGPLVAKVAILAAGPSVAAPLYWLFVDPSSPFASAFLVGGIILFTGSLVYATNAVRAGSSTRPTVSGESDPA